MCGISGYFGSIVKDREQELACMNEALRHRGPDDGAIWFSSDKSAGLAHRRLSIIDLSPHGRQPMQSTSGRFVAVFNGEIYNFQELRRELTGFGHRFIGTSDTEVMLAAFEEWGIEVSVGKLNGMFAVAVLDREEASITLFRDRLGVKPLYYLWSSGTLLFSSELTTPFADAGGRMIDRQGLALFFRFNCIPAPYTVYQGIYKLMPGVLATATKQSTANHAFAATRPYWTVRECIDSHLDHRDESMSLNDAVNLVEKALDRSVRQHMISDVPLGAFLSGGIDSSLVVAHMQKLSTSRVRTYTIGFRDQQFSEAVYARDIARHLGTEHTEMIISEEEALNVIPQLPFMYGEPFADSSQIPTFLVSKLTRQSITVALSGDGGDELFAGYYNYRRLHQAQRYLSMVPPSLFAAGAQSLRSSFVRRRLSTMFGEQRYDWILNILRLFARSREPWIPRDHASKQSISERIVLGAKPGASLLPLERCHGNIVEQMMCYDSLVYLPDDILAKVDRASMAVSLEVRAPFTDDVELFDTAWKIPFRHKATRQGGKIVLKEALSRHVPRALFERPKMGFGIPLARWLNNPLKGWVHDCVNLDRIRQEGYLNPAMAEDLVNKTAKENDWYAYKLWALCMFQSWMNDVHHRGAR